MLKYIIIFFIDIMLYMFSPSSMEKTYMTSVLLVAAFTILLYLGDRAITGKFLKKNHLRHSVFFIICFFIVFFQCDIDYVLGIIDDSNYNLWYDTRVVCKSLALSNIALISMIIGYAFNKNSIISPEIESYKHHINCSSKQWVGHLILFLLGLYVLLVPKEYLNNGYGSVSSNANLIIGYLQAGFIALFVLYSIDYRQSTSNRWVSFFKYPIILALVYIALVVMSGRRTEALRIASLIIVSYLFCLREKTNYKQLALFAVGAIGLFSISGVLRSLQGGSINESLSIISNFESISPFTRELAGSVNTLHIATSICPSEVDFNYGETFFPSFLKIIPGLSSLYEKFLASGPVTSSAEIFTRTFFSGDLVYGLGSSVVADVYLSFGSIGVVLIFIIFGYFLKYLEIRTFGDTTSVYSLALSFGCYSSFIFVCRSTFALMFLCWAYACIILYFVTRSKQ